MSPVPPTVLPTDLITDVTLVHPFTSRHLLKDDRAFFLALPTSRPGLLPSWPLPMHWHGPPSLLFLPFKFLSLLLPGGRGGVVGQQLLSGYWWPDDGWQRSTVARLCPRSAFSHMVAYMRQTRMSALRSTVFRVSLLDSASHRRAYGARLVLLSPAPAAGVVAGSRVR
jgi:hypothetical protein